ncbi:MAG: SAP domain-containing protein [Pseudanabaena sp.]|jgi:hypothetical protein
MLFNTKIQEIQSQVSANSLEIEALLLRVEELRAQNLAMENHLQQLGSAENAAESAIEQVRTALAMIKAISPDELQTFKGAIDSLFDCERPQLAACSEPVESDPDPEPEPEPPSIEAKAVVESESFTGEFPSETKDAEPLAPIEIEENDPYTIRDDLKATTALFHLRINQLRTLCKQRGLSASGNAGDLRRRILADNITAQEVEDFRSSVA